MSFHSLGRSGLARALVLSLAFHFLLLWPSPTTRQDPGSVPVLTARLRVPPAADIAPLVASPHPTPAATSPASGQSRAGPDAGDGSVAAAQVPEMPTGAATFHSGAPPEAVTKAEPEGVPDAEGLRAYRIALARQARTYKRYPPRAEEAGWTGTAEVRVTVLAGGLPQEPFLLRSSGHAVLDEAALEMIRRALPASPVPPTLRQRAFSVDVPVVFELSE